MTSNATPEVPRSLAWSGGLLVAFASAVAANWVVAVVRGLEPSTADLAFAVLLLGATLGIARGLRNLARWAWLASLALSVSGLFFIAPVIGTILLGGGAEPVGTGWDWIYFPLMTAILLSVLLLLHSARHEIGRSPGTAVN